MADGLTFPTGVAFGDSGEVYVVEAGYSYGDVFATPRILELPREGHGRPRVVYAGDSHGPWTGIDYHSGSFFVAQGGQKEGGRIVRISPTGKVDVLAEELPSKGDHHTNGPVVGDDGWVYFGQGTVTNSAIVGEDSDAYGWLRSNPTLADTPCKDVKLSGLKLREQEPVDPPPAGCVGVSQPVRARTGWRWNTPRLRQWLRRPRQPAGLRGGGHALARRAGTRRCLVRLARLQRRAPEGNRPGRG